MKKLVVVHVLSAFFLFTAISAMGQQDIFNDLFESEDPVFHTAVSPAYDSGSVEIIFYFTHSKLEELEAFLWIKNLGSTMSGEGDKNMMSGALQLRNQQPDTVTIRGLQHLNFYSIGVDFRKPNALSRKASSAILKGGYRYEYQPPKVITALRQSRTTTNNDTQRPTQQARSPQGPSNPCREPEISVWVEPSGFCGDNDRPAILLQANNFYQEEKWEFAIEVRTESSPWSPLHMDAEVQPIFGKTVHQEPLCSLKPGLYYARVLAWGPGCKTPEVRNISSLIAIAGREPQAYTYQTQQSVKSPAVSNTTKHLPDSCEVSGEATLTAGKITGTLELSAYSPCGAYSPYAEVRYIHPGYRDLNSQPVLLAPGRASHFEFNLDNRDLARNVHPVQVVVYARPEPEAEGVSLSSFWLRPAEQDQGAAQAGNSPAESRNTEPYTPQTYASPSTYPGSPPASGNAPYAENQTEQEYASSLDETMMEEHFDTVGVRASDPNCTQIQNLKLYYHRAEPDKPVFISWLNPRCCQRNGCSYTVWVGSAPDKLRLLVEGNKPGATISELLQRLQPDDSYYEVVVETSNGDRKAAYAMGEGPIYGYEDIIAYRDRLAPPSSDPIGGPVAVQTKATEEADEPEAQAPENEDEGITRRGTSNPSPASSSPGFSWNGEEQQTPPAEARKTAMVNEPSEVKTPSLAIKQFDPCKYRREIKLEGKAFVETGEEVSLSYDHSRPGYRYTLYHQAAGSNSWGIAPGTQELQAASDFRFQAGPQHNGKYLVLAYKPEKGWGCLSAPENQAIELKVASAKN